MKNSIKKLFVMLAIVMSFVAVQSVCAATVEVVGEIEAISYSPPTITVEETVISGMKLNYLCNQYNICLKVNDEVTVVYEEVFCKDDGTIKKNKATSITVGDVTVEL